jgi:cytochrome c peroxidase
MPSPVEDYGRYYVTEATADQFKFRTASLLNVELTAPYGHAGQFAKLEDFVQHYDRARDKFHQYDVTQLETALRSTLRPNGGSLVGSVDVFIDEKAFSRTSGAQIVTFLRALTDPAARSLERIVPSRVPSGLPVDHP